MTVQLTAFIVMDKNAKEVIQFYEKALDAKVIEILTFGGVVMPENPKFPMSEEAKELVSKALLKVGESDLMLSDTFPGAPYQKGNNVTINITTKDVEKSKQIYEALEQGGQKIIPLTETHFSPAWGKVTDKFGVTFQINTQP
jgi:PhnB protein